MIVAIGSNRKPKILGVRLALLKLSKSYNFNFKKISFQNFEIHSSVSDTPLSIKEILLGGEKRAFSSYKKIVSKNKIKFGIGVEGGVFKIGKKGFLQSWTVIYDGTEFFYGASCAIELPDAIFKSLFIEKKDLGKIIDNFSKKINVRSNEGTWGILTNDFYSRKDSFRDSTINAFMPILNKKLFKKKI